MPARGLSFVATIDLSIMGVEPGVVANAWRNDTAFLKVDSSVHRTETYSMVKTLTGVSDMNIETYMNTNCHLISNLCFPRMRTTAYSYVNIERESFAHESRWFQPCTLTSLGACAEHRNVLIACEADHAARLEYMKS